MSLGAILTSVLLSFLLLFLLVDLIIWLRKKETMSQWIIKKSKQSIAFTITTLTALISTCVILIQHWELISILRKHYNKTRGGNDQIR